MSEPTVDATADLYVHVVEADITCAVPRDHCNCAVAQAIKRAVGREDVGVHIFPSVAYVLMPTDRKTARARRNRSYRVREGQLAWHRFRIDPILGKQIIQFDLSGAAAAGGYRFRAPTEGQTLAAKRLRSREGPLSPGSRTVAPRAPWLRERVSAHTLAGAS